MAEEKSQAETPIPRLGKKADLKIENNGTLEEFKQKIIKLQLLFWFFPYHKIWSSQA